MKTMMSKYLDIDVDYVTVLDFQGFRDIVDEFDGVDVNISADMCYTDSVDGTDINLKKGPAKLEGMRRSIMCVTASPTVVQGPRLPMTLTAINARTRY